jgi:hypothetical protein
VAATIPKTVLESNRVADVFPFVPREAVECQPGGTPTFVQSVPVRQEHNGQVVWDGTVTVFDLKASPTGALRAYAWSYELPDGKRCFVTVLHTPQITGPREAVATSMVSDARARK